MNVGDFEPPPFLMVSIQLPGGNQSIKTRQFCHCAKRQASGFYKAAETSMQKHCPCFGPGISSVFWTGENSPAQ